MQTITEFELAYVCLSASIMFIYYHYNPLLMPFNVIYHKFIQNVIKIVFFLPELYLYSPKAQTCTIVLTIK